MENTTTDLKLRDYQVQVISQIYHWYTLGKKSVMLVSPTGSGKTLTAAHIIRDAMNKGLRILFIVHRESLIDQTAFTLIRYGVPQATIGFVKAGYPEHTKEHQVILSSVQTLARRKCPTRVGLVIFDESHTTAFYQTSMKLIRHYAGTSILPLSKVKFLHLTATPFRSNEQEYFGNHVEVVVKAPSIEKLIEMGYLVPFKNFSYGGIVDFSKIKVRQGEDFKPQDVGHYLEAKEYIESVIHGFIQVCPKRKAIAFSMTIRQSLLLTKAFNAEGIKTEHIQAETSSKERKAIYQRFKTGETQIISSVCTLTEGFDEPSCEAIILARPTTSYALYLQMCGRGLRLFENKENCYFLDFGENFKRLGTIDKEKKVSLCPAKQPVPEIIDEDITDNPQEIPIRCDQPSQELADYFKSFGEYISDNDKLIILYLRNRKK